MPVTQAPEPTGLKSAQRLLRSLLYRPRPEVDVRLAVQAAEIPERVLQAAVSVLGAERRDGQWRLPGWWRPKSDTRW